MSEDLSIEEIKKTFGSAIEIQPVLSKLALHEVRLLESSSYLKVDINEFKITSIEQNIYIECHQDKEKSKVFLQNHFKLTGKSDANDEILRITAKFGTVYNNSSKAQFDQNIIVKFAQLVGLNIIWPYWREFVQTMTARMSLPPLSLPLVRPGDLEFVKVQDDSETTCI
jgi:preprotein translocase subunit SecB